MQTVKVVTDVVGYLPSAYTALKSMYYNYGMDDDERLKAIYANLEPACFMNMIACMAIAPEDMRPRATYYATLIIDRDNDIRNTRNGDLDNYVWASRNLINHWNRILIIALTIFPPFELRRVEPKPKNNTNLQTSIEGSSNNKNNKDETIKLSNEESSSKDETKKDSLDSSTSKRSSSDKTNENISVEEGKNKETTSLNNTNKDIISEKSKKSDSIANQNDNEEFELVEIVCRVAMCNYMINGFNKIIRTYSKLKNGDATVSLLKNYITIVEGALKGEKLPPIPGKPIAKSVVKHIKSTYTDKEFEYVLKYLDEGNKAALIEGYNCATTKSACETIEGFTKKIGTEHKKFMDARAFL